MNPFGILFSFHDFFDGLSVSRVKHVYVQESDSKTRKAAGTLFPEAVVHFVDPDDCVVREAKTLFHKIPETEPYLPFYRYRAWVLYSTRFSIRPEYECENSDTMSCESLPHKNTRLLHGGGVGIRPLLQYYVFQEMGNFKESIFGYGIFDEKSYFEDGWPQYYDDVAPLVSRTCKN